VIADINSWLYLYLTNCILIILARSIFMTNMVTETELCGQAQSSFNIWTVKFAMVTVLGVLFIMAFV
jgi:hypothetical protein